MNDASKMEEALLEPHYGIQRNTFKFFLSFKADNMTFWNKHIKVCFLFFPTYQHPSMTASTTLLMVVGA